MNVVQLRQSVGRAVAELEKNGEPIILDKGHRPVAVLISLQDFKERFVEKAASLARENLMLQMDDLARPAIDKIPTEKILRDLRDS